MRRTFAERFKLDVLARAREVGSRAAAEERGITRSLLMRWAAERGASCAMVGSMIAEFTQTVNPGNAAQQDTPLGVAGQHVSPIDFTLTF